MPSVTSMRIGTPRSRSNCVCRRNFALSFAARGSGSAAWTSTGRPFSSVPSTSVSVCCTSFSRGSRAIGCELFAQFGDDFLQPLGLKDVGGFAERAQRSPLTAEFALHLPQFAGLLDGPQGADHGIERNSSTSMQYWSKCSCAVAGLVALAADLVQARQERSELVEILQARHVLFAHVFALLAGHAGNYARSSKPRNTTCVGFGRMRKSRAEQDWGLSHFSFRHVFPRNPGCGSSRSCGRSVTEPRRRPQVSCPRETYGRVFRRGRRPAPNLAHFCFRHVFPRNLTGALGFNSAYRNGARGKAVWSLPLGHEYPHM